MAKHNWVEMQITPIQADLIDTEIITSSTEEAANQAAQDSIEICFDCHAALNPLSIDEECPGVEGRKEV